ncbi:GTP-binding protein [Saccharopolyspora sp. MS10]|uniref:GTP-binding protein n=1 Tax=Saccharopolyspora sp. MS10 TaxID=3385973 RepID=UPI00399FA0A7
MDSADWTPPPESAYVAPTVRRSAKILVVGPAGVGKTTFVDTMSEITPLHTEESLTSASEGVDDLRHTPAKTRTTVALDFGRRTLNDQLVLYLFGTPGQQRFAYLWQTLARNALGALVLADARRLADSFEVMDRVEEMGVPYAIAVNAFDAAPSYQVEELREALDPEPSTPVGICDARDPASCTRVLIDLVEHLLTSSGRHAAHPTARL